jgi:hypothetical protein
VSPGLWLLAGSFLLLLAAGLVERHQRQRRPCRPCTTDRHERCRPVTPPDLPGERGCCCGQLVPL